MSARLLSEELVSVIRSIPRNDFGRAFSHVDLDGDGFVNAAGLRDVLAAVGLAPSSRDLDALNALFAYPDSRVSVSEFTHWASNFDESTASAPAAVGSAVNRLRGALMGQEADTLRDLFRAPPEAEAAGAPPVTLSPPELLTRVRDALGLHALSLGDVSGIVALSDRNSDGDVSYMELKRLLRAVQFEEALTRVLRHAAARLRGTYRTSLGREAWTAAATARAAAASSRLPFPAPAADGAPTLTPPALRELLLGRLGAPLSDAQLTALAQALDVAGDGWCCDVSELLFLAGEGSWAESVALDRSSGLLPPQQPQPQQLAAPSVRWQQHQPQYQPAPLLQQQQQQLSPRPPPGPLTDYCDLVPEGVDVLDDTWDVPLALLQGQGIGEDDRGRHEQHHYHAPASLLTLGGVQSTSASLSQRQLEAAGGGQWDALAPPPSVPGVLPPPSPYAPAAPHGSVPAPRDLYSLPLLPATLLGLWAPHDLAAAVLTSSPALLRGRPLPPHLRAGSSSSSGSAAHLLGAAAPHDGYVSSPHPWPSLVDHAFVSFATPTPGGAQAAGQPGYPPPPGQLGHPPPPGQPGYPPQPGQLGHPPPPGQAGYPPPPGQPGYPPPPGQPGSQPGHPAPPGSPLLPPAPLSLESRALGQALSALGLPRPSHLVDALAARYAGGAGAAPPPHALGPLHRVSAADFRRIVDELSAAGEGLVGGGGAAAAGLHSVTEARLRRALVAAACGSEGSPVAPGEARSAALLTRAEVAYALQAAAGGPAGLTEAEAAAVAAWAPGPFQADALAAVAWARVIALTEGGALAALHTTRTAAAPAPLPPHRRRASEGGTDEDEEYALPPSPAATHLLGRFLEASAEVAAAAVALPTSTSAAGRGRRGAAGGPMDALSAAAEAAAAEGRLSRASSASTALAAACPRPDVCPGRFVSWLRLLALGGGARYSLAAAASAAASAPTSPQQQSHSSSSTVTVCAGEDASVAAAAGASPVALGSLAHRGTSSSSHGPLQQQAQQQPPHSSPAPLPPGCVSLVAALDPLSRHALRKLLGPAMALPGPAGAHGAPLLRVFHPSARALVAPGATSSSGGGYDTRQRGYQQQQHPAHAPTTGATLPCGSGVPGCGDAPPLLSTAFVLIQAQAAAAAAAAATAAAHAQGGGAGGRGYGAAQPLAPPVGLPASFHPSRLALLASAEQLSVAAALADGLEPDPGGTLISGSSTAGSGAPHSAAAGGAAGTAPGGDPLVSLLLRETAEAEARRRAGGSGGAESLPPPLPNSLSPSASAPPSELASRLAQAAGLSPDGLGLGLRLASILPGSLAHGAAAGRDSGIADALGCVPFPTTLAKALATAPTPHGGAAAAAPPPLRPLGGGAALSDSEWAYEGHMARPSAATALVRVGAAEGVPSPASDAVRACIAGRLLRAALVEYTPSPDPATPPRLRILSSCVALAAAWTYEAEDRWEFPGLLLPPVSGGAAAAPAGPPELVLRCDQPRGAHAAAAASAAGGGGAAPPAFTGLLVELNAVLVPPHVLAAAARGAAAGAGAQPSGGASIAVRLPPGLGSSGSGGGEAVTLPLAASRDAALAMLMLAGQQQQQQPHGPEAGGGGGGGPAAAGGGSSGGGGPSAVVAPGSPSGSASDDGSWQGGGGCEEVTCAWGVVPLAQLLQKGGGGGGTRQVIQLSGGSPGAPCDIAPADILRRRSGWLAALGGGGGGPPRTTLTLTSLPLSGLRVAERQALGRLPLTIVAPRAAVALLVAWRSALAAAVLATASRAHLSAGAGAGSLEAPGGPGAALAALSALAAEPGFLGSPGHMPAAAGGVAALLASAFEAEARAVLRAPPATGGPPPVTPALYNVALRAWAGSSAALASVGPRLVSSPSAAALSAMQAPLAPPGSSSGAPVSAASLVGAFSPGAVDVVTGLGPSAAGGPAGGRAGGGGDEAAVAVALSSPPGAAFHSWDAALLHRPFSTSELSVGV